VGGALSCLAVVPLLNWLGGPNAVVFSALAMAAASVIWAATKRQRGLTALLAGALLVVLTANYSGRLIDIVYAKGHRRDQREVLFARWNAISRVEVDETGSGKNIVIDADASTLIMHADPRDSASVFRAQGSAVPSFLRPHGDFAIIGPGGGVDVLTAVANGSPNVIGIEINPLIASTIMREVYADYSYHLYQIPEVHIQVGDGRSWIRSSRDRFDVLQMTLVDTWASTAAGAFALSENNLYTLEAFREYFDHLKPNGFLAITRWEFQEPREALRVVSQAMEALRLMNVEGTTRNFIVLSDGPLNAGGQRVTILAKKSPFTQQEQDAVRAYLTAYPRLISLYMPSRPEQNVFSKLIESSDARSFASGYPYNVSPVSDNAPFFFFTFKTLQAWRGWRERTGSGVDWKNNLGVVVLAMVLFISVVAVMAFLVLPLLLQSGTRPHGILSLAYFMAVGVGYITVEIALIQHFVLFLGHPTYALTVVVFLLLLSSGVGSMASRSWLSRVRRVRRVLGAIVGTVVLYLFVLPIVLPSLVGLPVVLKLLLSGLLLVPLGFLMGMPFPTGLRALSGSWVSAAGSAAPSAIDGVAGVTVEWAWAMNAASSVLGSVLAMVLAIHLGLSLVLACAAGAYVLAAALTLGWGIDQQSRSS
jgi:spermidine synthase